MHVAGETYTGGVVTPAYKLSSLLNSLLRRTMDMESRTKRGFFGTRKCKHHLRKNRRAEFWREWHLLHWHLLIANMLSLATNQ